MRLILIALAAVSSPAAARALHAGCVAEPAFSPAAFFTGNTRGEATLHKVMSKPRTVTVRGQGHVADDGALLLDQWVTTGDTKPKLRHWIIRETTPGHYAGSLTDTRDMTAETWGNCLFIRFRAKGGLHIHQTLWLQPGGQVALNRLIVKKMGMRVARLEETIRRVD